MIRYDNWNNLLLHSDFFSGSSLSRDYTLFLKDEDFVLQKIVLSSCPQLTTQFLYISVLPTDLDAVCKRTIVSDVKYGCLDHYSGMVKKAKTLSFRNVRSLDLSKCPNVHFDAAIDWMKLAFPELRAFIARYCLLFQFEDLQYLLLSCPWINEIDLSIDTSVILSKYSIISSRSEARRDRNHILSSYYMQSGSYGTPVNPVFSNISKLILEGRNDITGMENILCFKSMHILFATL